MISAGFGCRAGSPASEIVAALQAALANHARSVSELSALYAPDFKRHEPCLAQAAAQLGKPLVYLPRATLEAEEPHLLTHSEHARQHVGLSCVAESAALAGARAQAPSARVRLLGPRSITRGATCALAITEDAAR